MKEKEHMLDIVITRFGFEAEETLSFCQICFIQEYPMVTIEAIFLGLMES